MLFILQFTRWLYNSFAGALTATQLAYGLCLGFFIAMMPFGWTKAHVLMLLGLVVVTRASWGLFGITAAGVKPLMMAGGDTVAWKLGHYTLESTASHETWKKILNAPVVALVELDRYLVMGGFILALVCAVVFFFPIRQTVVYFRETIQPKADQYRIIRWWRGFWLTKMISWIFVGDGK